MLLQQSQLSETSLRHGELLKNLLKKSYRFDEKSIVSERKLA